MSDLAPEPSSQEDKELETSPNIAAVAILVELLLLGVVLVIGRLLHRAHVVWIGDAGAALLLGLVVGLIIKSSGAGQEVMDAVAFKPSIFLYVFLPTIMFDAGYALDPKPFVRNIGSVCLFAFAGTTISAFIVGYMMYAFGLAGWCTPLSAIHNLLFGAIISATDPVTVLAIFSKLGANPDLYINVFGESVLNDAVAMVLYNTMRGFVNEPATVESVFRGIGIFFGIFIGSVVFGTVIALLAAVLFRTRWFMDEETSLLETGMVVVIAFISYLGAQSAYMSGIVSVLFCGMVMRAYVTPNLSQTTQLRVEGLFKTLAGLFELFLFIYIGLTLFLADEHFNVWAYTGLVLIALAISRACNIYPLSALVNWTRLPERRIPQKQQFMMWWSGLRGAMAFALAIDAADSFGEDGQVMKTCTFYIVFLTVLVNGGATGWLLGKLDLKQEKPLIASDEGSESISFDKKHEAMEGGGGISSGASDELVGSSIGSGGGKLGGALDALDAAITRVSGAGPALDRGSRGVLDRTSQQEVERNSRNSLGAASMSSVAPRGLTSQACGGPKHTLSINRLREYSSNHFEDHMDKLNRALSKHLLGTTSQPPGASLASSSSMAFSSSVGLALTSAHSLPAPPSPSPAAAAATNGAARHTSLSGTTQTEQSRNTRHPTIVEDHNEHNALH